MDEYGDECYELAEFRVDFELARTRLTEREGQVLDMWLDDYLQDEIAEELGINQSTVSRILQSALKKLREASIA